MFSKYIIPLSLSILFFTFTGFYPTDCDGTSNCRNDIISTRPDLDSCYFGHIPLKGKVKFVTSFPDIKIKFVESFPDVKIKFVNSFPDDCGEWQIVESFPDFTIQVVESFPDIEVKVVNSFPGIP